MSKTSHESETNNKYYLVRITKAIDFLSHDNTLAQGIDDNAYEHVRKAF